MKRAGVIEKNGAKDKEAISATIAGDMDTLRPIAPHQRAKAKGKDELMMWETMSKGNNRHRNHQD